MGKKAIDWETIERYYRFSTFSIRQIAKLCGVSEKTIRVRASKEKWTPTGRQLTQQELDKQTQRRIAGMAHEEGELPPLPDGPDEVAVALYSKGINAIVDRQTAQVTGLRESVDSVSAILKKHLASNQEEPDYKPDPRVAEIVGRGSISRTIQETVASADKLIVLERKILGLDDQRGGPGGAIDQEYESMTVDELCAAADDLVPIVIGLRREIKGGADPAESDPGGAEAAPGPE